MEVKEKKERETPLDKWATAKRVAGQRQLQGQALRNRQIASRRGGDSVMMLMTVRIKNRSGGGD